MNDWASVFLVALAATLAGEALVAGLVAPRGLRAVVALYSVCLNLLSLPLAWLGLSWIDAQLMTNTDLVVAELVVVVVEALGYRLLAGISTRRAIVISVLANATPVLVALALAG